MEIVPRASAGDACNLAVASWEATPQENNSKSEATSPLVI
jgi:hypothetical protein